MSQLPPISKRNQPQASPPLTWAVWSRREYHRLAALRRPVKKREQEKAAGTSGTFEAVGGGDARH